MEIIFREKGRVVFSVSVPCDVAEYLKQKENVSGYIIKLIVNDKRKMEASWDNDVRVTEDIKKEMNRVWNEREKLMQKYKGIFYRYEELVYNNKINYPYNEVKEEELRKYFLSIDAVCEYYHPIMKYWEKVAIERRWE